MGASVKLKALIDEMQCQMDEWTSYFNKKTGEIVSVSDEEFQAAEEGYAEEEDGETEDNEDFEELLDVDKDRVKLAADILENRSDYIELPSKYDINEYEIMERFCLSIEDEKESNILLIAIKGSGAFRRFQEMIRQLGIEDDWYRFRDEEYKAIAIEWCNDNEIKYEE